MNLAVVTQARMTSTRLPGKVLADIHGKPMLHYHVDRLRRHDLPVVVATTTNDADDPIVAFCETHDIKCFRGDEHDVLARYYETARAFDLDVVVRVTSDCPLIDGAKVRKGIDTYLDQANLYDYLGTGVPEKTYPLGFSFEVFGQDLLTAAHEHATHPKMREHVTPYMKQEQHPDTTLIGCPLDEDWSDYRVTVDTPDDLTLVRRLAENWNADRLSLEEIVGVLQEHPDLQEVNQKVHQKKWFE